MEPVFQQGNSLPGLSTWPSSTLCPVTLNKGITLPPLPPTNSQDLRTNPYLSWNRTPPPPSFTVSLQIFENNWLTPILPPPPHPAKKHCYLFPSTFVLFVCLLFNIVKCVPPSYGSQSRCGFHIQWVCYLCCVCGYLLLLHLCSGSTVVWIINYFIMLACSLGLEYGQGRAECVR